MTLTFNKPLVLGRKAVFNPDAFTVIGSPSITEEGIVSDFSPNDYITAQITENITLNEVSFYGHFKPVLFNSAFSVIVNLGVNFDTNSIVCQFGISNLGKIGIGAHDGSAWKGYFSEESVQLNTEYDFHVYYKNDELKCDIKTQGADWANWITAKPVLNTAYSSNNFIFGGGHVANSYFKGAFNLKEFKVFIKDELVFSGSKFITPEWQAQPFKFDVKSINQIPLSLGRKAVFAPEAFTVTGSPEITDEGIMSGITTSSYAVSNGNIAFTASTIYEIDVTIKINSRITKSQGIFHHNAEPADYNTLQSDITAAGYIFWSCPSVPSIAYANRFLAYTSTLNVNDYIGSWLHLKYIFDGEKYIFKYAVDGGDYIEETASTSASRYKNTNNFLFGWRSGQSIGLQGEIDLKSVKIYTDGQEVFSGSKLITPEWEAEPFKFGVKSISQPAEETPPAVQLMRAAPSAFNNTLEIEGGFLEPELEKTIDTEIERE